MWTQDKELMQFLYESAQAGYASGDEDVRIKEPDGSTSIIVEQGPWRSHDNWFSGEPFAGRIIVSCGGEAVWNMFYSGGLYEGVTNPETYDFLRCALKAMPRDLPLRGPKVFVSPDHEFWRYEHECSVYGHGWYGGDERIFAPGTRNVVYSAWYRCGPVNSRK